MSNENTEKKDVTKELKEKLLYTRKNVYDVIDDAEIEKMEAFAKDYMKFLDASKTERDAVKYSIGLAKAKGFTEYHIGDKLEVGGKYYYNNRERYLVLFTIGEESIENGFRIGAAHIDSPRLDLKPLPLYEDGGFGYFKTHYYGGVRKYQWVTVPLALHGVLVRADGSVVEVNIGEDEGDPIFYISDLLPHLAKDQNSQSLGNAIPGEKLNIIVGSRPLKDVSDSKIKLNVMSYLNEKYGIVESDFMSAELTAVPAMKAREVGFDRSLIAGYGHDDRVCAYPALASILDESNSKKSIMIILADKEETGSGGNTGMKSWVFNDIIDEAAKNFNANANIIRANSKCLSADVNAAFDPNFGEVYERMNSCFINHGVVVTKYTGSGGKSGTSDASAEFVGFVRKIFDEEKVVWQTGELGKVDQGGGGTVAVYIAEKNIDVVDLGVPVIAMHAPYELISKADLYMTYKAFIAFNK